MYDVIGDVHGHASALRVLLEKLGYEQRSGAYRHPERQVLFLGDFIDRGPEQLDVIDIVRNMIDAGSALAVSGNHEYNAVAFSTEDPRRPGQFLRKHSDKNRMQHRAFLEQVGEGSDLHRELIEWFKSLPLWIELPGVRIVHACWHPESQAALRPYLDTSNRMTEEGILQILTRGTAAYEAASVLLKGIEIDLPKGVSFFDKDGVERFNTRIRWWDEAATTFDQAAIVDDAVLEQLVGIKIPAGARPVYDGEAVCFVGHYWLSGEPAITSPKIACLDYSVAKGGVLTAYRYNSGESVLTPGNLVWAAPAPAEEVSASPTP